MRRSAPFSARSDSAQSQRFQRKKPSIAKIVSTMIAMITQNASCVPSPG